MLRKRSAFPSLIDEFFGKDMLPRFFDVETGVTTPAVNIIEGKDDYRIEVAAPGLDKKDFKIDLDNRVLTISSEREEKNEVTEDKYMRREFSYTSFTRSFVLPDAADIEKISASHKEGILNVTIPKRDEAKVKPAKQINIQ
jgi:HSP20 family protein